MLSANTGNKTNKFHASGKSIDGSTTESFTETDYAPGQYFVKTPAVTITKDSADCYTALALDYYGDTDFNSTTRIFTNTCLDGSNQLKLTAPKITEATLEANYGTIDKWNTNDDGLATGKWTLIATSTEGAQLYMYGNIMTNNTADQKTNSLFDGVTVKNYDIKTASNIISDDQGHTTSTSYTTTLIQPDKCTVYGNEQTQTFGPSADATAVQVALPQFVIDINGYAVQATGLTTSTDATAQAKAAANELIKQANGSTTKYTAVGWVTAE